MLRGSDTDGMTGSDDTHARLVGINHVALEVGDVDAALEFYGAIFGFELRGRSASGAFLDMGDQFLALSEAETTDDDDRRHLGLVVDDPSAVEDRLEELGIERLPTSGLDVRDPWGNRLQIIGYEEVQFTKADHVLRGMDLAGLEKRDAALEELSEKGMAPG